MFLQLHLIDTRTLSQKLNVFNVTAFLLQLFSALTRNFSSSQNNGKIFL